MPTETEKFMELKKTQEELKTKKIRLEEQCKNKEQELRDLVKEIEQAGYKPNELKSVIQKKETEIKEEMLKFETSLQGVSKQLSAIEEG
jgi:mRNA-degrading endonuclease HigB of HigAB toxin-antitoxin module